ncbi:MAG: GNAT family N-acetyltransferase [Alphaproteobacteria bacterium]|nr:GNAT family N-acetyltransferase [Rhizobiaceae bacterium]MBU3960489.1 GNAT family N-acetyltransferase [Alphaproteobacteria bacterium]MBU4052629.1 GNAT family N-acetyltransferase [Alphaproteobacteria bacterium]MBU4089047.1 GNAT family N-acetyltransferase [Alphaproteobacteria bacterium]MBU4156654.1 GNAT family N-acetyltransferase [Alphaproteobacteria bacterium]
MSKTVEVRPLQKSDLAGLLALYAQLIENDLPLAPALAETRFDDMLKHDGLTVFGGFADGILASTCVLIVVPNLTRGGMPYAFIENVVTDGAHRRTGLGRQTVKTAIDAAFDAGCYTVRLQTGGKRPGTLDFYRSCGFDLTKHGLEVRRIPPR